MFLRTLVGSQVEETLFDFAHGRILISGGRLVIIRTHVEDSGTYICTAKNSMGEVSTSSRIRVF